MNGVSYAILIGSVLSISVADVFIKKAGISVGSFVDIFKSPWFIAAAVLYIVQVIGFGYLLYSGAELSWVGIIQTVLYALVVIGAGVVLFHETLSLVQVIGIVFAMIGLVLLNLKV